MALLARQLLGNTAMVGTFALAVSAPLLAGCPIPFPSEGLADPDAGPNAPPVIQSATPSDLAFNQLLVLDRGDDRLVTLHIKDPDIDDALYVRMFRDYTALDPTPILVDVEVPATGDVERLREIQLATWCAGLEATDEELHFLTAMVADRPFLDCAVQIEECMGQPLFRELPAGAEWDTDAWTITCNPPL